MRKLITILVLVSAIAPPTGIVHAFRPPPPPPRPPVEVLPGPDPAVLRAMEELKEAKSVPAGSIAPDPKGRRARAMAHIRGALEELRREAWRQ